MRVFLLCLGLVASGCQTEVEEVRAVFYCPARPGHCLLLNGQAVTRSAAYFPCEGVVAADGRNFSFPTQKAVGRMVADQVTRERRCE